MRLAAPHPLRSLLPERPYNDAETIFKDSLDSNEQREFGGFALVTEEVEYPSEPTFSRSLGPSRSNRAGRMEGCN